MKNLPRLFYIIPLLTAAAILAWPKQLLTAQGADESATIIGVIYDNHDMPIRNAHVIWKSEPDGFILLETTSQADGLFALNLTDDLLIYDEHGEEVGSVPLETALANTMTLYVERPHFQSQIIQVNAENVNVLRAGGTLLLKNIVLERRISPAFWIATAIFAGVLVLIALGKLHNTLAALLGASLLYAFSY
ncbi:MAG: hypothetical protein ACK2TV_14975, partial [Anaerolineales bacterium]